MYLYVLIYYVNLYQDQAQILHVASMRIEIYNRIEI